MTILNSASRRLVRNLAIGATAVLATACSDLSTGPSAAAAAATPSATSAKLAPSAQANAGRSGYMLSSGLIGSRYNY
jgi:hypothetical protein